MGQRQSLVDINPAHRSAPPGGTETHLSVVLFAGERAYKIYKPVDFGFVDASTLAQRHALCEAELACNRRFAPDVYLGVLALTDAETEAVVDYAVAMRRLPAHRRLARLLLEPDASRHVREVAKRVAAIHAEAPSSPDAASAATMSAVAGNWDDNLVAMEPSVGTILDTWEHERVAALAHRYLAGREALFRQRIDAGLIVDGHGDLLAEDIFCLPDGPRILDCLAFSDRLRYGDVLADVAFLAMDIERLAGPELARQFMAFYREFSAEAHPGSLAHHYVAYRAHVRAKVMCLRAAQGDEHAPEAAARLLRMTREHLERARVRLVVVGGTPGTGKTTISLELGQIAGWAVLRTDEVRKELAGIPAQTSAGAAVGEGLYRPTLVADTYAEMLRRARELLSMGESVILDASWVENRWRDAARQLAADTHTDIVELRCDAPFEVVAERVRLRRAAGQDASDATLDVAVALRERFEVWPEAFLLDTSQPLLHVVHQAVQTAR